MSVAGLESGPGLGIHGCTRKRSGKVATRKNYCRCLRSSAKWCRWRQHLQMLEQPVRRGVNRSLLGVTLLSIHAQLASNSMNMFACERIRGLRVRQSCSGDQTLMCFLDCILWQITVLCDLGRRGWSFWVSSGFAQGANRLPLVSTRSCSLPGSEIQPP